MPYIQLSGSETIKVSIEPTEVKGNEGEGYPRLIISLRLDVSPRQGAGETSSRILLDNLRCGLHLQHGGKISDAVAGFYENMFTAPVSNFLYEMEFPLSPIRIEKIEQSRKGDLDLLLYLRLAVGGYRGSVLHSFENLFGQIPFSVPRSHWIEHTLPAIGHGKYFIVEVPEGPQELGEAWKYVEAAERSYLNWDLKGVSAHCREVGTLLDARIKSKFTDTSFLYTERWTRGHAHFASLALHEEDLKKSKSFSSKEVVTDRADAEHLILVTKALIKYAMQLLRS